ncbi:MAG: AAC(3) family N-acetyltransferase [Anaerolineales bacterium]|nr:AAC(3) family N-acetyltransferase [Anaerolineales bacterium]
MFANVIQAGATKDAFKKLKLGRVPVVIHASLSAFGYLEGGANAIVAALLDAFPAVLAPTFTYKTMVIPLTGPPDNGITYGSGKDQNRMAEFFSKEMPADPLMGIIPETLRQHPQARRSSHPILSFAGVNADKFLKTQSMDEPLAPLGTLVKAGGWALLLGVDHTVNTTIHYAETLAERKTFIRWALTGAGVVECPSFPGCSAGFQAIAPELERHTRKVQVGKGLIQAVPLKKLVEAVVAAIRYNPLALLCAAEDCGRCNQIRALW